MQLIIRQPNTDKADISIEIPSEEDINFLKEMIQVSLNRFKI